MITPIQPHRLSALHAHIASGTMTVEQYFDVQKMLTNVLSLPITKRDGLLTSCHRKFTTATLNLDDEGVNQ